MKNILLSLLGCTLLLVTSAQSKKITIDVNDKVTIDMVLISPDTFIRKNYYGDTLCDYGRLCPVMGKGAYNGYDTIVLAPYYMAKFEVTQQLYTTVMHRNPSHLRVGVRPEQTSAWGIGFRLAMDAESRAEKI